MTRWMPLVSMVGMLATVGCGSPCDAVLGNPPDTRVGEIVYGNRCRTCHGPAGEGDEGPALGTRVPFLSRCEVAEQVMFGSGDMPGFDGVISDEDISSVTEYRMLEFGR